jgi:hypothetical protein
MKKIIIATGFLLLTSSVFSADPPGEKVAEIFEKTFPETADVKWYENENTYEAHFFLDGVRTHVFYTKEGDMLKTIRYYEENKLPPFVLYKLKNRYPDKTIGGITELADENGPQYYIWLKNKKCYLRVKASSDGNIEVLEKFKNADPDADN